MKQVSILIADSHPVLRLGVRTVFQNLPKFHIIGEARNNSEVVLLAQALRPDIVIMDLNHSDGGAAQACRDICASCLGTKVLFLSPCNDDRSILSAISAGAEAFVSKGVDAWELVESVTSVAIRMGLLSDEEGAGLNANAAASVHSPLAPALLYSLLAPQERRILPLVAQGMTNKEIGRALGLSHQTVRNYLSNVARKVKISRRSQLAALFAGCCEHPQAS